MAKIGGVFTETLNRNNAQIKADRAEAIIEDGESLYKRVVEDLEKELRRKERERKAMLDISPSNSYSFISAKEFDADQFVQDDVRLSLEIKTLSDKLEVIKERFLLLFGKEDKE